MEDIKTLQVVKVRYDLGEGGPSYQEYTYLSEDTLTVGDRVWVPVRDKNCPATVSAVDVPEAEYKAIKDIKTIPAGSKIVKPALTREDAAREAGTLVTRPFANTEAPEADPHDLKSLLDAGAASIVRTCPENDPRVLELYEEGKRLLALAEERLIFDRVEQGRAADDMAVIRNLRRALEDRRKEYVAPLRAHLDAFNKAFKEFVGPLELADSILTQKMKNYNAAVEEHRRKAEETNRKAMEVAREQAEQSGTGEFSVDITPVEAPASARVVRTGLTTGSMRDNWKAEVVKPDDVPREYMMVDMAMLNAIAKNHHDKKPVPGVRFYNDPVYVNRGK